MFFLDTETSGRKGLALWHPKNRLLQVAIIWVGENVETFNRYIKYDDGFFIPEESTDIHNITNLTINSQGVPVKIALQDMLTWVGERSQSPQIYAHNAEFDRNVLRIALFRELGLDYGREGKEWSWKWYCTLEASRDLLPEVGKEFWPEEKPYSLKQLCTYNKTTPPDDLHNAIRDTQVLKEFYLSVLQPKIKDLSKYLIPKQFSTLDPVTKIPGVAIKRAIQLQRVIQQEFTNEGSFGEIFDYSQHITPPTMLTVGHLLLYGKMRYDQMVRRKNTLGEKITLQDQCVWYEIAKNLEILLRVELKITNDSLIANIVGRVCNRDVVDLIFHTAKETGETQFFPTMRGRAVSFLPLKITEKDAKELCDCQGWGTIGELANEWQTREPHRRSHFYREVTSCIENSGTINLEKILSDVIQYS